MLLIFKRVVSIYMEEVIIRNINISVRSIDFKRKKGSGLDKMKTDLWNFRKKVLLLLVAAVLLLGTAACSSGSAGKEEESNKGQQEVEKTKEKLIIADLQYGSARFSNAVVQFIIENGYGYETGGIPGDTIPLFQGVRRGDVDIYMECWVKNQKEAYDAALAAGEVIDLGPNFKDSLQGWFVPTYVIKGDAERGIEPMAPDLHSVYDLPKYWELFKDPENPNKGRFYNGIHGWELTRINKIKLKTYGLEEYFTDFHPGSSAALTSSLYSAYQKGEPWFGYFWSPSALMAQLDLTQIKEPPFSEEKWNKDYGCAYPSQSVNIIVHKSMPEKAPEVVEFLKKYEVASDLICNALAYMEGSDKEPEEAARKFLLEEEDLWTEWVPEKVAEKVKNAL